MQQENLKKVAFLATLVLAGSGTVVYATDAPLETAPTTTLEAPVSEGSAPYTQHSADELLEASTVVEEETQAVSTDAASAEAVVSEESTSEGVSDEAVVSEEAVSEGAVSDDEVSTENLDSEESVVEELEESNASVEDTPATDGTLTVPSAEEIKVQMKDAMTEELEGAAALESPSAEEIDGAASALPVEAMTVNGLVKSDKGTTYTDNAGVKYVNRWRTVDGNTYYFGADGYAVSGLYLGDNGDLYYFDVTTKIQYKNRWRTVDGETYLFNANGVARRGAYTNPENGDMYYFDEYEFFQYKDAVLTVNGLPVYFNKNGVAASSGLQRSGQNGKIYYFDTKTGEMYRNRWRTVNGSTYYFDKNGEAVSGLQVDANNGAIYYFDVETKAQYKERWRTVDGNTYWFNANGTAIGGELRLGEVLHFFDPVTRVQFKDRWKTLDGNTYWFNAAGITQKGFLVNPDTKLTHFFDYTTGIQVKEELVEANGNFYYFDKNGVMVTNRTYIDEATNYQYKFDEDGVAKQGLYLVADTEFAFDVYDNLISVQTPNMKENRIIVKYEKDVPWMYDLVLNQKKTYSRGVVTIGDEQFFFNANGSLASGTQLLKHGDVYQVSSYGLVEQEKTEDIQYGVDISRYNGTVYTGYAKTRVDFEALKAQGVDYVIIRAGSGWQGGYKDQLFEEHYRLAKAAGLGVGTYFYTYSTNAADAAKEMNLYMSYIKGKSFDYPVYIDMEEEGVGQQGSMSRKALTDLAIDMMEQLEANGYYTGIYANANWLTNKFDSTRLQPYDVWLAQWRNNITYEGHQVGMWQYTDSGRFDGHTTPFDLNASLRDYPTIIRGAMRNGYLSAM